MNTREKVPTTTTTVSTCHICAENFATFDDCEKHVSTRHVCCMFSCPSCTQLFHTSEELNVHGCPRSEPSSLSLSNRCEECGLEFVGMRQLLDHATVCQGIGEILYGCNGCGAKFSVSDDLDRHIETCCDNDNQQNDNQDKATEVHENSKWRPHSKTCLKPVCNPRSHASFGNILRAKKCTLKCSQCEHVFTHEAFLSQHALYHTGVKPHLCAKCGRCFEQPSQLRAHRKLMCSPSSIRLRLPYDGRWRGDAAKNRPRKSVRIADPEFTILKNDEVADTSVEIIPTDSDVDSVGAETFQTERETENIRSEHKHSPRTCDDVGFLIVESSSCRPSTDASSTPNDKVDPQKTSGRTPHRLSHLNDDRNFNCLEARTVNKGGTRHTKRVHNKRSSTKSVAETSRQRKPAARTFHCKLCGETFTTERFLTSHYAKNHGGGSDVEKRLVCGKCGKQFGEQFLLLAHMAVHNGIQKCETCSKLFTTVDALQMHQRVHRRKMTPVKCGGNPAASADKTSLDSRVAVELPNPKETALTATVNETEKVDLKRCHTVDDCDSNTVWGEKYGAGPIRTRLVEKRAAKSNAVKRLKIIVERPGKTELAQFVKSASERLTATPDSPDVEDGGGFESDEERMSLRIDVRSDFRCAECDKYFVSAEFLRAHTELHRVAPPGFGVRCTRCRERFDYLFEMHAHVAQQHGSRRADTAVPAVLICIKCGVRAETVNRLLLHALTHTGEMPNRCISCAQCFLSRLELEQHACTNTGVLNGRPNSRSSEQLVVSGSVVSCSSVNEPRPAIGTAPSDNTGTIRQPTDVANGSEVTTFECRECEKQFMYRYEVLAHETSHTSTTQCSLCNRVFAKFHQLKNHLRWHTGEMVLRCQVCDASFCSLVALRKHCAMIHQQKTVGDPITVSDRTASRTPTPAPPVDTDPEFQVQCPVCDRWFAGRSFLTTHVRLHVSGSVKPGVWFTCVHCSKRFNFQYELQTHVSLLHADMKCILCHRRFSDESSLRVDALQHTGELPYTCDSCNKSFRSETQLRSHIDSSHLVVHTEAPMERTPPDLSCETLKTGISEATSLSTAFYKNKWTSRFTAAGDERHLKTISGNNDSNVSMATFNYTGSRIFLGTTHQ